MKFAFQSFVETLQERHMQSSSAAPKDAAVKENLAPLQPKQLKLFSVQFSTKNDSKRADILGSHWEVRRHNVPYSKKWV